MVNTSGTSSQEFTGKTVEEAMADGLRVLGLRADDATIEILSRGSRGLFGIGSEPAIVRISRRAAASASTPSPMPAPTSLPALAPVQSSVAAEAPAVKQPEKQPEVHAETSTSAAEPVVVEEVIAQESADGAKVVVTESVEDAQGTPAFSTASSAPAAPEGDEAIASMASEMLSNIVRYMNFDGRVQADWHDADAITEERHLLLSVHGKDISGLIGRRGDTLENIQYLLRLMVNQRMHRWLNIIVDVEEFRAKRVEHLTHLAKRMADQVVSTSRSFALEPMTPNERRIVHLALRDDDRIFTESTGEGERRKVVIFPSH